jgi:hypothetical protein
VNVVTLAATHVGYVAAGYGATGAGLLAYSAWVLRRGRRLAKSLAPTRRAEEPPWR